jgi:Cu-Zn family superoxide dismutase
MNRTSCLPLVRTLLACAIGAAASIGGAAAAPVSITMKTVTADGVGNPIGTVTATDTTEGLTLAPSLSGLPPGDHGFHLHARPSCEPGPDADKGGATAAAFDAGGHFDPEKTSRHEGPKGAGHKGDLPALTVADDGRANRPVVAPHLKTTDLAGHALMIHAGGDNYADQPTKLGGGGGRIACGVIAQ